MRLLLLSIALMGCAQVGTKWGPWVVEEHEVSGNGTLRTRKCRERVVGRHTQYECRSEVVFITPVP